MTETTEPVQTVDLTAPSGGLTYVEVLTPAGIVRVNTNLIDWRTKRPVVTVEIEPNTSYRRRTAPGGDWETGVREPGILSRTDITLTKRAEDAPEPLMTTHQGRPADARDNIPKG